MSGEQKGLLRPVLTDEEIAAMRRSLLPMFVTVVDFSDEIIQLQDGEQ